MVFLPTLLMVLLAAALRWAAGSEAPPPLRLVPFPKDAVLTGGELRLDRPLRLIAPPALLEMSRELVRGELQLAGLDLAETVAGPAEDLALQIIADGADAGKLAPLPLRDEAVVEEYTLRATTGGVAIHGGGAEGLLHGIQTFRQLVRANRRGAALPCLEIRDWPSVRWRAFQDDITRGPSSTLDELRREVSLGAYLKLNVFTYYMESQFAFRKHPLIGPEDGSLLPEELEALVDHARPLGVNILGNQQSFAHLQNILKHDAYRHLREDARTIRPAVPETYRFLDDLYSEVIPLVPFEFFNVCCDETWNLGAGPSRDLAREIGVAGVYLRHIQGVHALVRGKYSKRMMMWGDIILQHPDRLDELPRDIVMLTWGYDRKPSFEDQIIPFARSGFDFFVCPGVKCWSEVLPNYETTEINIRNFIRDGVRHGALGVLITSWDDDGENLNSPSWYGFAWGAECAWNASETPLEDFQRRIGGVLFGVPDDRPTASGDRRAASDDRFAAAIRLLSAQQDKAYDGFTNRRFWEPEPDAVAVLDAGRELARWEARREEVRRAIEHLEACRKQAVTGREILESTLFGARRFDLFYRLKIERIRSAIAYRDALRASGARARESLEEAQRSLQGVRDEYAALRERWKELWLGENRPYALDRCLARYDAATSRLDRRIERLAEAIVAARAGGDPPPPAAVGLEIVETGKTAVEPAAVLDTPLRPESRWLEPGASHRMALSIAAADADRRDLPLEVELSLPEKLARSPARAFLETGWDVREVPAQIDPARSDAARGDAMRGDAMRGDAMRGDAMRGDAARGDAARGDAACRLTAVLSGTIAAGAPAMLWVYLGREAAPSPLPESVCVEAAPGGGLWIENSEIRLLVAPEGAHVYRWEVKALGGLDLTMAGESGWAGFSDLGGRLRSAVWRLRIEAEGPALAEIVAAEAASGAEKRLRLFAEASWLDVRLGEGASYYWDFDWPEHFDAAKGGQFLFSGGKSGPVRSIDEGAASQVRGDGSRWAMKHRRDGLALGLLAPEGPAGFRVGPGGNWGGVGIEDSPPVFHLVTFGCRLGADPAAEMERLGSMLSRRGRPSVSVHALQPRKD
ncbi:MAG: family 20 glycosylhydrolase [Planctomycetes bacterium]|nr:family 20 glycosylhydrolase [Planctomycetota bacterium]